MGRHLGDFQTPPELAAAVLRAIGPVGSRWPRVLEPTCGAGAFLKALLEQTPRPRELIGIEVQEARWREAAVLESQAADSSVRILRANLFDLDLRAQLPWSGPGPLLVLGNPPWITAAALGRLGRDNGPGRRNVKSLRGIEARTGASNFDVAEAVWIKLLEELAEERPTLALLCKTSAARAVLEFAHRRGPAIAAAEVFKIDARRWFGAAVDACLLRIEVGPAATCLRVPVFPAMDATEPVSLMGFSHGRIVADLAAFQRSSQVLGTCALTWRQGLKHDAAAVMELTRHDPAQPFRNKLGEEVDVEPEYVYPLLKGTDLRKPPQQRPVRRVIVTQRRIGQSTADLEAQAPRLWSYLQRHAPRLAARKSSIYRGQPPFALFGVGPYTFTQFKVAVSGLHREPMFRAVGPTAGRPVLLDDTCYVLPCESATDAAVLTALCNQPMILELIAALSPSDAKRRVTKRVLQQLDLFAALRREDPVELAFRARTMLEDPLGNDGEEDGSISAAIGRLRQLLRRPPARN